MNIFFWILFIIYLFLEVLVPINADAATYYFSSTKGSDAYPIMQTMHQATPSDSVNKATAVMSKLKPCDTLLFKCRDIFKSRLRITRSGSTHNLLVFSSYGNGEKSMMGGCLLLPDLKGIKPNIWTATSPLLLNQPAALRINYVIFPLGRCLHKESSSGEFPIISPLSDGSKTVFIDTTLYHYQDWSGIEAGICADHCTMNCIIMAQQKEIPCY